MREMNPWWVRACRRLGLAFRVVVCGKICRRIACINRDTGGSGMGLRSLSLLLAWNARGGHAHRWVQYLLGLYLYVAVGGGLETGSFLVFACCWRYRRIGIVAVVCASCGIIGIVGVCCVVVVGCMQKCVILLCQLFEELRLFM